MKIPVFLSGGFDTGALFISALLVRYFQTQVPVFQSNRPGVLPPLDELIISFSIALALLTGAFRVGVGAYKIFKDIRGGGERRSLNNDLRELVLIAQTETRKTLEVASAQMAVITSVLNGTAITLVKLTERLETFPNREDLSEHGRDLRHKIDNATTVVVAEIEHRAEANKEAIDRQAAIMRERMENDTHDVLLALDTARKDAVAEVVSEVLLSPKKKKRRTRAA